MKKIDARSEVDALLDQYQQYKQLLADAERLGREVAKRKLRGQPADSADYEASRAALQALSDAMTFASPTVWVAYKYEAYTREPQPIRTVHAFRQHCSKPGYICTKRFEFVSAELAKRGLVPWSDATVYPDDADLTTLYPLLAQLEADQEFMQQWAAHEYYRDDGRVAKWENYPAK